MYQFDRFIKVLAGWILACILLVGVSSGAPRILVLVEDAKTGTEDLKKGIGVILAETGNETSNAYSVNASIDNTWKVEVVNITVANIPTVLATEYADTTDPVVAIVCRDTEDCTQAGDYLNSAQAGNQSLLISTTGSSSNLTLDQYASYMMLMYPQNELQAKAIHQTLVADMPERSDSSTLDKYVIVYERDTYSVDLYYLSLVQNFESGDKRTKGQTDPPTYLYNPLLMGTFAIDSDYMTTAQVNSALASYSLGANDAIVYLGDTNSNNGFFEALYNIYTATNAITPWYAGDNIAEKDVSTITTKSADVRALAAAPGGGSKATADTAYGTGTPNFVYYYGYDTGLFLKKIIENMKTYSLDETGGTTQLSVSDFRNQVLNNAKTIRLSSEDSATGEKDFIHQGAEAAKFSVFALQADKTWSSTETIDVSN